MRKGFLYISISHTDFSPKIQIFLVIYTDFVLDQSGRSLIVLSFPSFAFPIISSSSSSLIYQEGLKYHKIYVSYKNSESVFRVKLFYCRSLFYAFIPSNKSLITTKISCTEQKRFQNFIKQIIHSVQRLSTKLAVLGFGFGIEV